MTNNRECTRHRQITRNGWTVTIYKIDGPQPIYRVEYPTPANDDDLEATSEGAEARAELWLRRHA
jgi:hypothetical protein